MKLPDEKIEEKTASTFNAATMCCLEAYSLTG
jgi:hypothetical protein